MKHIYSFIFVLAASIAARAQCTVPTLSDVSGPSQSICSGESATLSATTDGDEIQWFDSATGGNIVGTGTLYETGPLTTTTSFWAEAHNIEVGAPVSGGGKAAPTSSGGTTVVATTSPWGLAFTATEDFVLNSVDVFLSSGTPGTITIQLKDQDYNVLETVAVNAPAGGTNTSPVQFTVPLNLTIDGGASYKLVVLSGSPAMIRDLSSNSFPHAIGTVGTITGGTINNSNTNSNVYYFLYNWNFSPMDVCSSERVEVAVAVTTTPAPAGEAIQVFTEGQTLNDLAVEGENLMWFSDPEGTIPLPPSTVLTDGTTYYAQQTLDGCPGEMLAVTAVLELGVAGQALPNLNYYPNPVVDVLTLRNPEIMESATVLNLKGQIVSQATVMGTTAQIDCSNLADGIYFIKIRTAKATGVLKVLKR